MCICVRACVCSVALERDGILADAKDTNMIVCQHMCVCVCMYMCMCLCVRVRVCVCICV